MAGTIDYSSRLHVALNDIRRERMRQEALKAEGKFKHTPADVPPQDSFPMLIEEVGEVATDILNLTGDGTIAHTTNGDMSQLRAELVEVAAVAVGMIEYIDGR